MAACAARIVTRDSSSRTRPTPRRPVAHSATGGRRGSTTQSLHGQAAARGDALAPRCADCHGTHDILSSRNLASPTSVMNIPILCGECHQEGTEVSERLDIPQDSILQNYSLSIHGAGLFERGLSVTAVCTSCHTSHFILPHDGSALQHPRGQRRRDVHGVSRADRGSAHAGDRGATVGRGAAHDPGVRGLSPAARDPPRVLRRGRRERRLPGSATPIPNLTGTDARRDTVSMFVDEAPYSLGAHQGTTCAQCHIDVSVRVRRAAVRDRHRARRLLDLPRRTGRRSTRPAAHGTLAAEGVADAPTCLDCHEKHATTDQTNPTSPTYPRNVPSLCGTCHREGEAAARRIQREGRGHRARLRDEHPRKGTAGERPRGDGDVQRLPRGSRRAAGRRFDVDGQSEQRRGDVRTVSPRHRGGVPREHPLSRRTGSTTAERRSTSTRRARTATRRTRSAARTGTTSACS